jgi:glycosyltransferase involved in cell wall biosynthesis
MLKKGKKIKCLFLQKSFFAVENQKNLPYLSNYLDCLALVPDKINDNGKTLQAEKATQFSQYIEWQKPWYLNNENYFFNNLKFFDKFKPDAFVIDGNPWDLQSIQALVIFLITHKRPALFLSIKKNTLVHKNFFLTLWKMFWIRIFDKYVNCYISASTLAEEMLKEVARIQNPTRFCIHLGVDCSVFRNRKEIFSNWPERVRLIYVGKFIERKGLFEIFEAVKQLNSEQKFRIELSFLGSGPLKYNFEKLAKQYNWLRIHPRVSHADVADYLNDADIFICPSKIEEDHQEHDGHALMEAMATGRPSIVTKTGVFPDLTDERKSIFVKTNSHESIYKAISFLYHNKKKAEAMGEESLNYAKNNFSLEAVAKKRSEIIEKCLRTINI